MPTDGEHYEGITTEVVDKHNWKKNRAALKALCEMSGNAHLLEQIGRNIRLGLKYMLAYRQKAGEQKQLVAGYEFGVFGRKKFPGIPVKTGMLQEVWVDESVRGLGLGKLLDTKVMYAVKRAGAQRINFSRIRDTEAARNLHAFRMAFHGEGALSRVFAGRARRMPSDATAVEKIERAKQLGAPRLARAFQFENLPISRRRVQQAYSGKRKKPS